MMTHVRETYGIYDSLGYAGHGVAMATHTGKTVAEAIVKGNIRISCDLISAW
jgi:glycine/D-amino acid oxidase-like deaminating enzyme